MQLQHPLRPNQIDNEFDGRQVHSLIPPVDNGYSKYPESH